MANQISSGAVHHLTLTVTNLQHSLDFYTEVLGFEVAMELGPTRSILSNGSVLVALGTAPDPERAIPDDRFDENRVGLDHLSFSLSSREELDQAVSLFDEKVIPHGEIKDLGEALGLCVLAFRDPDYIQLELTAPRT
jgi:catechol 2,3-dioxygenase-like lactoylglutathione lyase family enzyme